MLQRSDLLSLEAYAEQREAFRNEVLSHKQHRRIMLGEHIVLLFEDEMTIRYQIQEMLRVEKVFEAAGIQDELDAYNPLIPDGDNWKCTLLIQYQDPIERKQRLEELVGIEDKIWLQIGELERIYPIADEDMDRSRAEKTASVHFLRYQLSPEQITALKSGAGLSAGAEHTAYPQDVVIVDEATAKALSGDLA
jgi:glycerol-3-phosphate dehydrogenase subunit C